MREIPKPVKRILRELSDRAYEAALRRTLVELDADFARWKRSEINSFDLAASIHKFHDGANRELYSRYADRPLLVTNVALALHEGLIAKDAIPPEVMPYLESTLSFLRNSN
jgi:hypothetical protein